MFAKITKGRGAVKLAVYLAGPGRSNEHELQHVVCASESMASIEPGQSLDHGSAVAMGQELNRPNNLFGHGSTRPHVWHASLSIAAEEGARDDVFWESVSREFMTSMGFEGVDGQEFRWAAVHHGLSSKGNDHVHIAVSMYSESGALWKDGGDFGRASKACREIENKHGLRVLAQGVKTRGYARGEVESLARRRAFSLHEKQRGQDPTMIPWKMLDRVSREQLIAAQVPEVQPKHELAMKLRGATAGARSESEFVRRARGNGLLVRPFFGKGGTTEVKGYSVALRPVHGEAPIWHGGGTLAKDLSLPSLRAGFTEGSNAESLAEWKAAQCGKSIAVPQAGEVSGVELVDYFKELNTYLGTLGRTDVNDPAEYARIAREGAGLFSSWAVAAGRDGDAAAKDLEAAAELFSKHSQLSEEPARAVKEPSAAFSNMCTHMAISQSRRAGAMAVVRAWTNMGEALGGAMKARSWGVRSEALQTDLRARLDSVHAHYKTVNEQQPASRKAAGSVGTLERPAKKVEQLSRTDRLAQLEDGLRKAGVPEAAIKARMFGESQKGAKEAGSGPFRARGKGSEDDQGPGRRKRRSPGQEKGLS